MNSFDHKDLPPDRFLNSSSFLVFRLSVVHYFLILLTFSYACSSGTDPDESFDQKGNRVITKMYDKDHVQFIKTYLDKSQKNYTYVSYYPDGKIMDSASYVNDTVDGKRKFYEEATGLTHIENYKNGILQGIHKAVYSNGICSFEGFRKNNQKVGEWEFRYANGNLITYEFYDSAGNLKHFRKYDEDGNLMKLSGSGIIGVYAEDTTVLLSGIYRTVILVAAPPGTETILRIDRIEAGQLAKTLFNEKVLNPKVSWEGTFHKTGKKVLRFSLRVKDLKSGREVVDTYTQNVKVDAG